MDGAILRRKNIIQNMIKCLATQFCYKNYKKCIAVVLSVLKKYSEVFFSTRGYLD